MVHASRRPDADHLSNIGRLGLGSEEENPEGRDGWRGRWGSFGIGVVFGPGVHKYVIFAIHQLVHFQ